MEAINRVFNNKSVESLYNVTNDDLKRWTEFFEHRARSAQIFLQFSFNHALPSKEKAIIVGAQWHKFSEFMPRFLCRAASMVSDNEKRHYVIQTAYEELGMDSVTEIHPDMFWEAVRMAKANEEDKTQRLGDGIERHLEGLWEQLIQSHTDAGVLGLLLGLEIPAVENIETLFSSLAYTPEIERLLQGGRFFKLHRKIEIEHVRLTVSNFLRFCKTETDRIEFMMGFDYAVIFWIKFWSTVSDLIRFEEDQGQARA